ncbi:mannitol dehydrogenase family protein [Vannielia litorea]|uniref:mannitol dehydrogenase family protein n=1 Tax=Vannielia litorea TaxID=1217970 RepID=UPI001C9820FE|nr:mannitol dehydrogenase family protein [Vannielia litorea]MBY6046739.1 mannitol dehydrogenase family protein [Vannielia litorea]MBY6074153.1 mannitol dehydrogenase family protein [Vannielia litorea]
MATNLSNNTLNVLPEAVAVPEYDRGALTPGILHIGVGNFHRAHMAWYLDRLFAQGEGHDWAIVGAGIKSFDAAKREALKGQDWLTTVVELDPAALTARVTGAMVDFCEIDSAALTARLTDPAIRIVSLTVTEGGYFVDAETDGFDSAHHEIVDDAQTPDDPKTVFGLLVKGLKARRDAGLEPFTVMSCDNLPENGHVAKAAVVGMAELVDPELAEWIAANVAFPCGMVDCITPATGPREIALVKETFGVDDKAPVVCEPFRQWVLEDSFPQGRPALEKVGVEFVPDVAPYETMKLRILNAGHAAIAYPSALLGHHFVHEGMQDADVTAWLKALMRAEVIPVLPEISGVDFDAYLEKCAERFANPEVGDTIARLCLDGSNRQPKFVLPTVREALEAGSAIQGLALEVALWCRYCAETTKGEITLEDERAPALQAAALKAQTDPSAFLALTDIFGRLGEAPRFVEALAAALAELEQKGVRAVLREYVAAQA